VDLRNAAIAEKSRAIPDILDMIHHRHPERVNGQRVAILVTAEHDAGVATMVERGGSESLAVRVFFELRQRGKLVGRQRHMTQSANFGS
jgi:hypothetical protein